MKNKNNDQELPFDTTIIVAESFELISDEANSLEEATVPEMKDPASVKRLTLDIETLPGVSFSWGIGKQYLGPDNFIRDYMIVGWAAKWIGNPKIYSDFAVPSEVIFGDEKRIVTSIWQLLDEADIVIGHNAKEFDLGKLKSKFVEYSLPEPSPYQIVDTLIEAKKIGGFASNSLNALSKKLNDKEKIKTNYELWKRCFRGETDALFEMEAYCKNDILLGEEMYLRLRPYIKNHPNMGMLMRAEYPCCPNCGSPNVQVTDANYVTQQNLYPSVRCECGYQGRSRKTRVTKAQREALIVAAAR